MAKSNEMNVHRMKSIVVNRLFEQLFEQTEGRAAAQKATAKEEKNAKEEKKQK